MINCINYDDIKPSSGHTSRTCMANPGMNPEKINVTMLTIFVTIFD